MSVTPAIKERNLPLIVSLREQQVTGLNNEDSHKVLIHKTLLT